MQFLTFPVIEQPASIELAGRTMDREFCIKRFNTMEPNLCAGVKHVQLPSRLVSEQCPER